MFWKKPTGTKRGRPSVPDEIRKRNNVTIRMRDALKAKLERGAEKNERSLSEEIAFRLDRSFEQDELATLREQIQALLDKS